MGELENLILIFSSLFYRKIDTKRRNYAPSCLNSPNSGSIMISQIPEAVFP